jgi:exopolysaccharide biosynthesis polyprenyl glycosylphosphotransferase
MERRAIFRELLTLADVLTIGFSFIAAFWICGHWFGRGMFPFDTYVWILWVIGLAWLPALRHFGFYEAASYESAWRILRQLVAVQAIGGLLLLSTMFLTKSVEVSRVLLQLFLAVSFAAFAIAKLATKALIEWIRAREGSNTRKVVVVCSLAHVDRYSQLIDNHPYWKAEIVGFVTPRYPGEGTYDLSGRRLLGAPEDLGEILGSHVVDEVMISPFCPVDVEQLATCCAQRGVLVRMFLDMPKTAVGRFNVRSVGQGEYMLSLETIPLGSLRLIVKRMVDIVGALIGLVICGVAYLIYHRKLERESSASPLFAQTRVGQNGRRFTLYKLRTMRADAEERLQELVASNQMKGHIFKMQNDPRVTPTGKFLRMTHLDELPQFWNVLRGEMSLVGTRPPTVDEVAAYAPSHHRRLSFKAGMTGLWQVAGNGEVDDFEEVVKLDCEYIDNWSLALDARILTRTLLKVTQRRAW